MRPNLDPPAPPSRSISDATHSSGNPDFFFLPPMVKNPNADPSWNAGAFNGSLRPSVTICSLPGLRTDPVPPSASTPCIATVFSSVASASTADEQYQLNWQVPDAATTFYRITVSVGAKILGWADVETASNMSQLKNVNTGEFVPLNDGRTLPIKFRIERYALCEVAGQGPCTSAAVNLATGGTVQTVLDPVNAPEPSGIIIPPDAGTSTVNITVESCPDLNPRATDLPTFGECVRITAEPRLPESGFGAPVIVFNCNVSDATLATEGKVSSHAQADRITLHQLDEFGERQVLVALPHAPACGVTPPISSIRGMFDDLRHGRMKGAATQMLAMLTPKSAYAAMFIDLGGGGRIAAGGGLSDFQFALPAKFTTEPSDGNVFAGAGEPIVSTVVVSDLGGDPVRGARVTFDAAAGGATPTPYVTGPDGKATTSWSIPAGASANDLFARGRGIAGSDNNGPRDINDPFQPIQSLFQPPSPDVEAVPVLTGSVKFHAEALVSPIGGFGFGSGDFLYTRSQPVGTQTIDFASPAYVPQEWSLAIAPFGSGGCAPFVTQWPINSGILARKNFSTRTATTLSVQVHIDNDIRLWIDGKEITSTGVMTVPGTSHYDSQTNWWIHDFCVTTSPPTFTANVPAGNHVLAVWATDRGGDSHFDVSISAAP